MLDVPVVCDLDVERAKAYFLAAGYAEDDIIIAESASARITALESGKRVALADASLIAEFPVDIVVEATGNPEAAAQVGLAALSAGKHLAMVSKEADSVIGPELARRARRDGLVSTPVDGD